ncbi:MAG TPA: dihydrofolate reductase family protein [Bacteroidales bacterium]|nr:dihydrofolate reductase family protein [Bacteroidales bacterium]
MKVVLVFVSTLNGKITRGDDPEVRTWSSVSDKKHYRRIWKNSNLVVMGSSTYTQNIIRPSKSRLIVVMTSRPELYSSRNIEGQLEFTSELPGQIVKRFSASGTKLMTVVGGSKIASSFLKASLVDELVLTIEPLIFGKGINLFYEDDFEVKLKLVDITRANEDGTLITVYKIKK